MGFSLQWLGPFLHWLTLAVLFVMPVLLAYVLYKLGSLPGAIARARGHPQADAVNACGWMGIITIVLWPVAMVWAHLSPARQGSVSALSDSNINLLVEKLQQASQRLAALENALPDRSAAGGGQQSSKLPSAVEVALQERRGKAGA